jgi:hypothetical protein
MSELRDLAPALLMLAAASLLMVHSMVRWTEAMLLPRRPDAEPVRPGVPATLRWGGAYFLAWGALVAAFLRFFARLGEDPTDRLPLLLLAAAGWWALNWGFVALVRALQRRDSDLERALEEEEEEEVDEEDESGGGDGTAHVEPAEATARREGSLAAFARQALWVLAALLIVAVGSALPPLQALERHLATEGRPYLTAAIALAALGVACLLGALGHLVRHAGRPPRRDEVRSPETDGAAADGASFAEIKRAWRARAWSSSPRWRRFFAVLLGVACLVGGLGAVVVVLAPAGLKLLVGGALAYAGLRTARGFARA